jgi:type VI secretion system protein ImpL
VQPFLRILTSQWVLSAFGLVAAGSMLWIFGPFLGFLNGVLPRVAALAVMNFVWLGANLAILQAKRKMDQRIQQGLTQGPAAAAGIFGRRPGSPHGASAGRSSGASAGAGAEDVAEQHERLTRALDLLRKARGTRGYLYEQPWYVIIGPPGSGKTTALANAGLRFPLAAELNGTEISGVGGTRYCDWSFTDEAVLIDTAGRYTTQDSDAATDKAGWEGFLDLLRKNRPAQPLNGVIVAISITDIALANDADRLAHARAIRARIKELYARLAARIPVYVVFTKMDLIRGFTDFFDDLDRERRKQVWGTTFPEEADQFGPAGRYGRDFEVLTAQVSARLIDRLQAEKSPERRASIADFPAQFASLESPVTRFLDDAFSGSRLEPAVALRGVYFASGTQEGNPIDRLSGALARGFGIDQRRAAPLRPGQGRGYFLETLLKGVIFQEAMLVSQNPRAARRRLILRGTAWTASGLALAAGLAALLWASNNVVTQVRTFDETEIAYRQAVEKAALSAVPQGGTDLPAIVPILARARDVAAAAEAPAGIELGLIAAGQLKQAGENVYGRALQRLLLPRLVSEVEARMRNRAGDLDYLYGATRVYLLLCSKHPMDLDAVRGWLTADWAEIYAGPSQETLRTALTSELDALLALHSLEPVEPDRDLLLRSQAKLANIDVADRAYALLKLTAAAQGLQPFVPAEAIGMRPEAYFVRASRRSLQDPIPGLFTAAGYRTAIVPEMKKASERAIKDSWVLGKPSTIALEDVDARRRVDHQVFLRYTQDYRNAWDGLLDDLQVVPPANASAADTELTIQASPDGPIQTLLKAMVNEFTLAPPPDAAADAKAPPRDPEDPAVKALEDHFRDLRIYVQRGLTDQLHALTQLQQQIAQQVAVSAAGVNPNLTPGIDAAQALKATAAGAPQPVSRWLQTLAQRGGAVRDDARRQQAAAAYAGPGGALPLCQDLVQKFPFRPAARDDVSIEAFADLFAPNGRFDTFWSQFVRPFADTTGKDWKLRDADNSPVAAEGLARLQRALLIRDTFFGAGGTQVQVRFAVRPISLDAGATQVTLDFGGITGGWKPSGAANVQQLDWPGATHMTSVGAIFDPAGTGAELRQTGPWALFRFLKEARLDPANGGTTYSVSILQGERQARFDLSAASAHSPFDPDLFAKFKCPATRP